MKEAARMSSVEALCERYANSLKCPRCSSELFETSVKFADDEEKDGKILTLCSNCSDCNLRLGIGHRLTKDFKFQDASQG